MNQNFSQFKERKANAAPKGGMKTGGESAMHSIQEGGPSYAKLPKTQPRNRSLGIKKIKVHRTEQGL